MKSYTHFTLSEREYLQKLLSQGYSFRKIADFLGRNVSSISREIKRNRSKYPPKKKSNNKYRYHAWRAENLYIRRRREKAKHSIISGSKEWNFIVSGLNRYWSPEMICGRWQLENPNEKRLCISTIYRYIKKGAFPNITPKTHLRRKGKRKVSKDTNYSTIHPDRIIPQWDDIIKTRSRLGDWEGDTVYGGIGKGLLVTLVDRKSRFLCAGLLESRNATQTREVIESLLSNKKVCSISLDNGSEFAEFKELERNLNTKVYFAEPHKPWQRGTNENTNDILRFFFPKGYDFHSLDKEVLQAVVLSINLRPRKCLGWKSAFEVYFGVALA